MALRTVFTRKKWTFGRLEQYFVASSQESIHSISLNLTKTILCKGTLKRFTEKFYKRHTTSMTTTSSTYQTKYCQTLSFCCKKCYFPMSSKEVQFKKFLLAHYGIRINFCGKRKSLWILYGASTLTKRPAFWN